MLGIAMAAMIPMIATTISSSMSVNPELSTRLRARGPKPFSGSEGKDGASASVLGRTLEGVPCLHLAT
jgi:hypothetical protein